ncbi:MAG: hypothetical protein V4671_02755, partial [Armatimonadota bacterium]
LGSNGPHYPEGAGGTTVVNVGSDGRFRARVAPGKNSLYLMGVPPGYLRSEDERNALGRINVTVAPGETKSVSFKLRRALTLTGTAVDTEGRPAAGAIMSAGQDWEPQIGTADAFGTFTIEGLKPGKRRL